MRIIKTSLFLLAGLAGLLLSSRIPAIENLQLAVQSTNVGLAWPSTNGEAYVVQFRTNLDAASTWVTLTAGLPAADGTNRTSFIHTNGIQWATGSYGSGGVAANPPVPSGGLGGGSGGTNTATPGTGFYRVVREGLYISGITNGMTLSGIEAFPYELGFPTNTGLPGIRIVSNGNSLPGLVSDKSGVLVWNTAFCPNGNYEIHGEVDFDETGVIGSATNLVTINNPVYFEEFTTDFGNQLWVYGVLDVSEADVFIDVYSDDGYIGTFEDYTTDGQISFLWDLTDPNNNVLTNETFYGVFDVYPTSSILAGKKTASTSLSPNSTLPVKHLASDKHLMGQAVKKSLYPPGNPSVITWNRQYGWFADNFVVAWGITPQINTSGRIRDMIQVSAVDILCSPAADDPYFLSPGNTFNGTCYRLLDDNKTNLVSYLASSQYRNFFFYGHGNSSRIGDYNEIQGWIVALDENEIRDALGNQQGKPYHHPYRFVFINTCNSAKGTLCEAFGIRKRTVNRSVYTIANIKARAFLGFLDAYTIPGSASDCDYSALMLAQLFAEWRDGANLDGIVQRAKGNADWPLASSATIYGAYNLYRYYPY